jgi:FAD binding domain-containing protein/berberine-like enzyme
MSTLAQVRLDETAVDELRRSFGGELVRPGDADYDHRRKVWNASVDRHPALIARCAGVGDVVEAVRFARRTGLTTAVRSGGHSLPGLSVCDDGIVIDLGLMKGISVDPNARTVRAQAGVLLGELDRETQASGLVVPAGIVSHTGVAGLTLGGGIGWTMRKFGLTIDQLMSADVVTADGELVRASDAENPDLFWGIRGGGGNFGIVTSFEFRLNPLGPMVLAGPVAWAMENSPGVMRFYRDWIKEVPNEVNTIVMHRRAPATDLWPKHLHGKHVVIVGFCYAGDVDEGEKVLRPMRGFGSPVLDACVPMPYVAHQAFFDPGLPWGWWYYFRGCDVAELTDEVIDITVDHALRIRSPKTSFPIFHLGGAMTSRGDQETAFSGRRAGHTFNCGGGTETAEGFDAEREWGSGLWEALKPHHVGAYVNFLQDEGSERVAEVYGAEKFNRLRALKRKYDPDNFFRLNQNISPD